MMDNEKELTNNIKTIARSIIPKRPAYRADYQMTLGSIIKALTRERTGLPVYAEFLGTSIGSPGLPHSYVGYHSDLAFVPQMEQATVASFLKVCQDSVDKSFIAPDGSPGFYRDYIMPISSPVWISELDKASKLAIIDVIAENDSIILKTERMEEK